MAIATYESQPEFAAEAKTGNLLTDIVKDTQELLTQHFTLFKSEVREDLEKAKLAMIPLAIGAALSFTGLIVLAFMGAELLVWLMPRLPMWGSLGIVAVAVMGAGLTLLFMGKQQLDTIKAPARTIESIKETLP